MLRHARRPPRTVTAYRPHKNAISRQNDKSMNFFGRREKKPQISLMGRRLFPGDPKKAENSRGLGKRGLRPVYSKRRGIGGCQEGEGKYHKPRKGRSRTFRRDHLCRGEGSRLNLSTPTLSLDSPRAAIFVAGTSSHFAAVGTLTH